MKRRFVYFLWAVIGLATPGSHRQAVNATFLATVTDSTGAAVGNAMTIAEQNTGISHTGQTNENGNYTFPDLPRGQYTVTAEVTGFKTEIRRKISLLVNTSTCVDFQHQPGDVTESAEVTGAMPFLEAELADTGAKIEQAQTAALPLGTQRNFKGLLNLVPRTAQTVDEVEPVVPTKRDWERRRLVQPRQLRVAGAADFREHRYQIFGAPGFFDLDFSLFKNLALNERFRLQLRAETFHSTKMPENANPDTSITSSTFGTVTGYLWGQLRTARPSARSKAFVLSGIFGP
jgi:hypothetical protein